MAGATATRRSVAAEEDRGLGGGTLTQALAASPSRKLGHGDEQHQLLPKKVEAFARRVVAVSAGGSYSLALTADDAVWSRRRRLENRKAKEEYDIASCVQYAENNQWTVGGEAEKSCVHVISCFQMCEDGYSGKKNPHNLDKYCTEHCSGF